MDRQAQSGAANHAGRLGIEMDYLGTRIDALLSHADTVETATRRDIVFEQPPSPAEVVERLATLALEMAAAGSPPAAISSVGVAVWGKVDSARGEIADPRFGLEWAQVPFAAQLSAAIGAPVRLTTGARAAARAESLIGSGKGLSPMVYIHLGRTLASALVIDGAPVVGAHDDEGRLSHWQTGLDGPRCGCGAYGHLGPLVSAQSLIRLAIGAAADDEETLAAIHRVTGGRAEALTVTQLVRLANQPVQPLRELLDYAVDALAGMLANLALTLDPAIMLIGGPLAQVDDVFFLWLRDRVAMRLAGTGEPPEVARAGILSHGALIGAML